MWRAECQACNFTAPRLTREEAEAALVAHIQEIKHQAWVVVPVPDRPDYSEGNPPATPKRYGR